MYLNHTECSWLHYTLQNAWDYLDRVLIIFTRWAWHNNYTHVASQKHDMIELELYTRRCDFM